MYSPAQPRSTCGPRGSKRASPDGHAAPGSPEQPELIAIVRRGGHKPVTPEIKRMLRAVPLPHTSRHPFSDVAVALP
jgi:hypothetical protein